MTKFTIKAVSLILVALLLLSLIERFSLSSGKIQIIGLWMVKAHNLTTSSFLPAVSTQAVNRIKLNKAIDEHLRINQAFYATIISNLLATEKEKSLLYKASLGLADAVKNHPQLKQQLTIIALQHPTLKVRCYWQAQLQQGTIVTIVNSPGPKQVASQYLVLPENNCPAKELDLPAALESEETISLTTRDNKNAA